MGRTEARAALRELLCRAPSADVIDAVSAVADEECVILLGRIARSRTGLAAAARAALAGIDHPRADAIAAALRPPSCNDR